MKQVFISGGGEVKVFDVPVPHRISGAVLVRNAFSLISTGTEGSAVSKSGGWIGLFEKAMQSRERLPQVWELARTQGVSKAWEAVSRKLEDFLVPGYSCAGQVQEVSEGIADLRPGDRVACMGTGFATHSEYVVVPRNLVAPIPEGVSYEEAAFGALACIALQGIRRLELTPGEHVGVVGLGLIGQIAVQLLSAMGYRAIGLDLSPERAARARELAGIDAWALSDSDSVARARERTRGHGLDGVLVCAASKSDEPINLAFDLCRKRGRVSLIGDVALNLVRARMYEKELELRMSCSYGPGRYDPHYELEGQDYPLPYVRWTEGRSLEYVLDLLRERKVRFAPLISFRCGVEAAPEGYARLKQGHSDTQAVLIEYGAPVEEPRPLTPAQFTVRREVPRETASERIGLGLIGCGSFTKAVHLPNLARLSNLFRIVGIATRTGATAALAARRAGAAIATSDYRVLLDDPSVEAVLVATRHASHGRMVLAALQAGKHVFVEKPMCITVEEGERIVATACETGLVVRVGFNRRFSPCMAAIKRAVGTRGPRMFSCRVNIGALGKDWSNTPDEGGRLMGEGVHFFDLCNWFAGSDPLTLSAVVAGEDSITNPNVLVSIAYPDGCRAQVLYTSLGHKGLRKEFYECFGNQRAVQCDDFRTVRAFGASAALPRGARGDKGHRAELEEFAAAIQGRQYPVTGADAAAGLMATRMALAVYQSAREGRQVPLSSFPSAEGPAGLEPDGA